jgi:antitoxin component HigA of HigAB toxin-antitoxin module
MTAIEIIQDLMKKSETSLSDLAQYGELGTKENVYQMLRRNDLKVGTFVKMLEVLGYRLVAQNTEGYDDEITIEYE